MTEHKGTAFAHSCIKMPVDPYSRQPTPMYERPRPSSSSRMSTSDKPLTKAFCKSQGFDDRSAKAPRDECTSVLEFIESIPVYEEVHRLSNEQFKQRLDYLKRKQRLLLKNLRNCLEEDENIEPSTSSDTKCKSELKTNSSTACSASLSDEFTLKGKQYNLEESSCYSPLLYPEGSFSCLAEDQDFLTYRCKDRDKAAKTRTNEEILSSSKCWSSSSESKTPETDELEDNKFETKSLPPHSPKRWHPTLPKPFSLALRDHSKKYMSMAEQQVRAEEENDRKKVSAKKRRIRPVPLTSKILLYDKLMAEKEERSRIVREESVLNLMSQIRPFKLECEKRALRALTRSSPELSSGRRSRCGTRFRARPMPRSLFSTEVYDRMIEDEYFRNLQKRIRSMDLLKSSSLPPSMAQRDRVKSKISARSQKSSSGERARSACSRDSVALSRGTPLTSEHSRSSAMTSTLPLHGNNLAAILRAQAAREKMERDIQKRLEEKRSEQMVRLRKSLIGRKPAWRALRSAARHEHERDLDFRASLRRDEAREQAERHRLQMELMLDRVTQIPTLFERYSQSCHSPPHHKPKTCRSSRKKKKRASSAGCKRVSSGSIDSYTSFASSSRPNSGSISSSTGTLMSAARSSASGYSTNKTTPKCYTSATEKKKVSINETAELIEDVRYDDYEDEETYSVDSAYSRALEEHEKRDLQKDDGHANDKDVANEKK
ncbi:protein FAM161A [Phymastichus coffea]|uniref:protein FAM161A n=1 Tax=Phymastichus coffea TaxID=108790 RepID=UPI00273BB025|nr:protein FAM161A [Phymastichus coffea]